MATVVSLVHATLDHEVAEVDVVSVLLISSYMLE